MGDKDRSYMSSMSVQPCWELDLVQASQEAKKEERICWAKSVTSHNEGSDDFHFYGKCVEAMLQPITGKRKKEKQNNMKGKSESLPEHTRYKLRI